LRQLRSFSSRETGRRALMRLIVALTGESRRNLSDDS